MTLQKLTRENSNWHLSGSMTVYRAGQNIEEKIAEYFLNREDAEKRKLYWESIFKQYENEPNNMYVSIFDLESARTMLARAAAWKPIDYEALRIDPYSLEVKETSHKMIITYLETNELGTQQITTEEKELNGPISEAFKEFEEIATKTRNTHLCIKEEGTDKRIINMEFKSSFTWGGTNYVLEEDLEQDDWYDLDYVKEISYWNGEAGEM